MVTPTLMYSSTIPNTDTNLYLCPQGTRGVITWVKLINPTGGAVTFTIGMSTTDLKDCFVYQESVDAGKNLSLKIWFPIKAGNRIVGKASAAGGAIVMSGVTGK